MNIALRRAVPAALTVAMALSATIAYAPAAAYADTHSSTELTLRQVDNPFNVGPDERHTIDEGDDLTLKGNITGGFGDVSHQWFVSTDGGKTWNEVEGASGSAFDIEGAKAGEYIYRFVATDRYGNTAHQDFYVTVRAAATGADGTVVDAAVDAVSVAVRTGDALPIAGIAGAALLAGGLAARSCRKQKKTNGEDAR